MKLKFWKALQVVRTSYWFVPSLMALAAIILGIAVVWVDVHIEQEWLDHLGWYQAAKPSGAREVLSTIAGSMITVAGVVFSITIVALSYASSQYGPRVLTNFMSDRGNTVTLGTFIATFVYCLVVLRTIRGGDEGAFVPQLAVLLGIALALSSIGVLIYFIHHVLQSIHINHVIAGIGRQLLAGVDERFPIRLGEPAGPDQSARSETLVPLAAPAALTGPARGYIQTIDEDLLLEAATQHQLLVRLCCRPGDYVTPARVLFEAWPAAAAGEQAARSLAAAIAVGDRRTPFGDLRFLINELVEIGARALSSGVNDPTTAMTCIDWLGAALEEIASRRMPASARSEDGGMVRVIASPDSFADFVALSLGSLREYVAGDPLAAVHMLHTIAAVSASCRNAEMIEVLETERKRLAELAALKLQGWSAGTVAASAAETAAVLRALG